MTPDKVIAELQALLPTGDDQLDHYIRIAIRRAEMVKNGGRR